MKELVWASFKAKTPERRAAGPPGPFAPKVYSKMFGSRGAHRTVPHAHDTQNTNTLRCETYREPHKPHGSKAGTPPLSWCLHFEKASTLKVTFMLPPTVDELANSAHGRGSRSPSYVSRGWWWVLMGLPEGRVWLSTSMAITREGDVPVFPGLGIAPGCACQLPDHAPSDGSLQVLSQRAFKTCSGFAGLLTAHCLLCTFPPVDG